MWMIASVEGSPTAGVRCVGCVSRTCVHACFIYVPYESRFCATRLWWDRQKLSRDVSLFRVVTKDWDLDIFRNEHRLRVAECSRGWRREHYCRCMRMRFLWRPLLYFVYVICGKCVTCAAPPRASSAGLWVWVCMCWGCNLRNHLRLKFNRTACPIGKCVCSCSYRLAPTLHHPCVENAFFSFFPGSGETTYSCGLSTEPCFSSSTVHAAIASNNPNAHLGMQYL